jgi:hypothetical protein
MLIATTGSGSINISGSRKAMVSGMQKNQDCWFRFITSISKRCWVS